MIYVSSSCVRHQKIADSIKELADAGFLNIELSGGTLPYPELEKDLVRLREEFGLSYLLHNYFPPPEVPFVLNLASLNKDIFDPSLEHCKRAIDMSARLGCPKFAMHAGFFIDIRVEEIGKPLSKMKMQEEEPSLERFCKAFEELKKLAGNDLELFIENNVLSAANFETYGNYNPLMFTDRDTFFQLRSMLDFDHLIDVAHLKVSCQTLGLDFVEELQFFVESTNYLHVSDNDGTADTNNEFIAGSDLAQALARFDIHGKTITLETYESIPQIRKSAQAVESLINA